MVINVEQLDIVPRQADPYLLQREPSPPPLPSRPSSPSQPLAPSRTPSPPPPTSTSRVRQPPLGMRNFQLGVVQVERSEELAAALSGPLYRPRRMVLDGKEVVLSERPVAFLSKLTSPAEAKLVASELELCCLAWAFGKLAHLLEGAPVTVITDHSSMEKMLRSTAAIAYGPTISRCRALLMPHLTNMRFIYRQGPRHTNVDALSRLLPDQGRSDLQEGHVPDSPVAAADDTE
ncbi:hypothetical protein CF326_g10068 [Tilletia indica]|nr:hypothetical protein CF326_g10068 [Tilletia indica]